MVEEPSIVKQLRKEEDKGILSEGKFNENNYDNSDFFRLAVDNSLDSIFVINCKKMIFVDVNKTACESTGYSREELLDMGPQDIKPEFTIKQLRDKFDSVLKSREKKGLIETVHMRKDGSTFPVEVFLSCLQDEDIIIASVRDITERKKNEEKLAETEKEYKLLIDSLNEGVWKIDKNSITTFVNKSMADMLGYTVDEMIGKHLFDFMDENGKKIAEKNLKRREKGIDEQHDFEFIKKDGGHIFTTLETSAILDEKGNYQGAIAGVMDITERRISEDKIKKSEGELKDFFDNANDLIQSVGPDGSFNYVNKKWREVMGYSEDEVKNLHFTDIIREDYVSHCSKLFKELSQGKSFDSVDVVFKTKNGEEIFVNGNLNSRVVDGEFVSTRGIFRDVTESKKREKQLSEARNIINRSSIVAFTWKNTDGWPVEYVSENVGNVFGYTSEDFLSGRIKFVNIIHPDDVDRVTKEVEDASRENDSSSFEHEPYRIITKNGSVKFVSDKSYIVRDKDGVLTHYKGLIEDVTEKQEMLNEIVKTKNKYTALVEQSNDGIIIVQDKEFKFANQALSKITGFKIDELTGMSFLDAVADSEKDKLRNRYKKRLSGEPVPSFYETKIKCSDGEIKPVELSASVLEYKGEPGILAFVRDISERKKFEEKVKESEKKYRETTELLPEIVFECDLEGKFSYANKVAFEKTGYSKEDIEKGLNVYDLIKDSELNRAKKNFKKIISDKKVVSDEFRITRKNGSDFYCMTYSSPILADGKVVGIRGVIVDISDRKEFENILKKSENKFKVFFNNSADAIFIHHPENFSILDVNEEACRRFGFTAEEMRKLTIDDISDDSMPALHSNTAKNLVEKLKEDETITMEWLSKNKSGETFWHEMKVKLININGNKRILATARDINKRKQADEKTERIMNAAADGMRIISKDFKVKEMNKTMEKLSGLETDKAIGMKCSEMFGSSKKCGTKECHMLKAMETGEKFQEEDIRKTKDGQKIPCLVMITPIKDSDGKISGIIEDFRDISEIKEKEKNLKEKLGELERWKKVTVGREHKMKELKEKIKSLENK